MAENTTELAPIYTVEQLSQWSGMTEQHWRNLIRRRELEVVRIGRSVRIERQALERYLESRRTEAQSP